VAQRKSNKVRWKVLEGLRCRSTGRVYKSPKHGKYRSGGLGSGPWISGRFHGRKWTGRACGGPEGCMVDRKGKRKAGNELEGYGITGPESVAVVYGRLGHSWSVESVKRGLSACTVESPLTT
jgi:hypothetical protein